MVTITFEITEEQETILLEELGDVSGWAKVAVEGQCNRTWKTFCAKWSNILLNDPDFNDPIPSNKIDFINLVKTRDDYIHPLDNNMSMEGKI